LDLEKTRKDMWFVVHDHLAKRAGRHFDLRLEHKGVYKSFVIPKLIDPKSSKQRLAIQVEDHDLSWGEFEGSIPDGEYGAGIVKIWDKGTYETLKKTANSWVVEFAGEKLEGMWILRKIGDKKWLIYKKEVKDTLTEKGGR